MDANGEEGRGPGGGVEGRGKVGEMGSSKGGMVAMCGEEVEEGGTRIGEVEEKEDDSAAKCDGTGETVVEAVHADVGKTEVEARDGRGRGGRRGEGRTGGSFRTLARIRTDDG